METTTFEYTSVSGPNIEISLEQTCKSDPNTTERYALSPGAKLEWKPVNFEGGCAKMLVYDASQDQPPSLGGIRQLLWHGIIPLRSVVPTEIIFDNVNDVIRVNVADGELPQCASQAGTKEGFNDFLDTKVKRKTSMPTWWWVVLFLTLLIGLFILKSYLRSSRK